MSQLSRREQELNDLIEKLGAQNRLRSWNSFVTALDVPSDLAPALMTQRVELLRLAKPRDMTAAEVKVLYALIAGLIETNLALNQHAEQLALLTANWMSQFTGMASVARQIDRFANFQPITNDGDDV